MMRTELIPQTKSDLGSGTLFYHFSLQTREKNPPNAKIEHQIAFFEVPPLSLLSYPPITTIIKHIVHQYEITEDTRLTK